MNLEPIVGRYLQLRYNELDYRIFFEEAGQGVPLLCLHTAGADSRQYRHLLNDAEVAAVLTYVRVAWGNPGTPVAPAQANALRKLLPE